MRNTSWYRPVRAALVLAVGGVLAAACGSPSAGPATTTTTTTTTLPPSLRLNAASASNGPSILGAVLRIPVLSVADGARLPTAAPVTFESPLRTKIGYRQLGSGPDLLLVMGMHGTMTDWDPRLLSTLAAHFRVTLFDLPGVGYSGSPPGGASLDADADAIAGFIDALQLVKPIVLGWGLGGTIALDLTERHPGLVARLVLADATAGGPTAAHPRHSVIARLASPLATLSSLSQLYFPMSENNARLGWLARLGQLSPDVEVASSIAGQTRIWNSVFESSSIANKLSTVRVPVLVIAGGRDVVVPFANATALAARLPHVRLVQFRHDGYAALIEPSALNAIVTFGQAS